jgi:hypothetical protein
MIDDLKEQKGVHDICGLGTCRDRMATKTALWNPR